MSRKFEITEEQFLREVAEHQMTIVQNDGVHRHLFFGKPGDSCMHFHIVTFPGYLCYTGDMGSFVFSRLKDMFEFFRSKAPDALRINPGYWAEKLQATDRHGGYEEWDPDDFRQVIGEHYLYHFMDRLQERQGADDFSDEELQEIAAEVAEEAAETWQELEDDVFSVAEYEHEAYQAANRFQHNGLHFTDLWEHGFKRYSYRFQWCCYALAWAIQQYDKAKATEAQPA